MTRVDPIRVVNTDLDAHPAVRAWCELNALSVVPERIEILKGKEPKYPESLTRIVCRLVGIGSAGVAIIGKRSRRANAVIENMIYEDILPRLPILSFGYFGMLEEKNGEFCWLFLEDAGNQEYSTRNGEHRELIVQWLSLMHASATHLTALERLPEKGPNHYLKQLQLTRDAILENLPNLPYPAGELAALKAILRHFDLLELHWDRVSEFCTGTPQTLVHGDFVAKNIRVRKNREGMTLLPFDWGEAGWGPPAIDIMQVEIMSYWSMIRGHWPWFDVYTIQRLAIAGKIFRCLDAVYWELPKTNWLKKPKENMKIYQSWLADAIQEAELED